MWIHTVYFWMHENSPAAAKEQLVQDCYKYLGGIPTVKQLWAGPPAMTPREVVDNSYQVGLTVVLEDSKAHDVYQQHALHMDFITRNKEHWKRVQVYDYLAK